MRMMSKLIFAKDADITGLTLNTMIMTILGMLTSFIEGCKRRHEIPKEKK